MTTAKIITKKEVKRIEKQVRKLMSKKGYSRYGACTLVIFESKNYSF